MQQYLFSVFLGLMTVYTSVYARNWAEENRVGGTSYISELAVERTVIYAATWGNGMFYSIDKGDTWLPMNNGLTNMLIYTVLAQDSIIMIGTEGGGVFFCNAHRKKWQCANEGLPNNVIFSLTACRGIIFASAWIDGVFRTVDRGRTWTASSKGLEKYVVYTLASSDSIIFAGTAKNGLYQSVDEGKTWKNAGLPGKSILCILPIRDKIWVGTWKNGIYCYIRNEKVWETISGTTGEPVKAFTYKKNTETVYCAKRLSGVYQSPDYGRSCLYNGLAGFDVFSLAAVGDRVLAGTWGAGVFLRADGDTAWMNVSIIPDIIDDEELTRLPTDERELQYSEETGGRIFHPLPAVVPEDMSDFSRGYILCTHACFSEALFVCYKVRHEGNVSISLYDYMGRLRKKIIDYYKGKTSQKVSFSMKEMTAGVYYVLFQTLVDAKMIPVPYIQ